MKKEASEIDDGAEKEFQNHQEARVKARLEKNKDKEKAKSDLSYYCATFDLPAVLTTPYGLVGKLYCQEIMCMQFHSLFDWRRICPMSCLG